MWGLLVEDLGLSYTRAVESSVTIEEKGSLLFQAQSLNSPVVNLCLIGLKG